MPGLGKRKRKCYRESQKLRLVPTSSAARTSARRRRDKHGVPLRGKIGTQNARQQFGRILLTLCLLRMRPSAAGHLLFANGCRRSAGRAGNVCVIPEEAQNSENSGIVLAAFRLCRLLLLKLGTSVAAMHNYVTQSPSQPTPLSKRCHGVTPWISAWAGRLSRTIWRSSAVGSLPKTQSLRQELAV